ncbi:MAG: DUF4920 domain-containing protein [Sphingobacteriaceae bacterium]|nr:DUF4920 domain-containing protein [Sphingobacteriaceae bacterium]
MKNNLLLTSIILLTLSSCSEHKEEAKIETAVSTVDTTLMYFGDTITQEGAISIDQLSAQLAGKDSLNIKVTGTIEEVCQKKGCWMNMNLGNGQSMKVRFKDYAFFVPKDAANKTVFIEGYAFIDTISVADQKHYAEDAGETKEEIAKIKNPEISISFEANGVIIKK